MSFDPTVSVVIPTRNRARTVARAISSACAQSSPPLEVIVVDDGSTDDTTLELQRLRSVWGARLRVIRHDQPLGGSGARSIGLAEAHATYVAFLDDDDEWLPRKLELQVAAMQLTGFGAATCGYEINYGYKRVPVRPAGGQTLDAILRENIYGSASLCIVRADLARDLGGFDRFLLSGQDWDFWIRIRERTDIAIVQQILAVYHVQRGNNISDSATRVFHGSRRVFLKHRRKMTRETRVRCHATLAYLRSVQSGSLRVRFHALGRVVGILGLRSSGPYLVRGLVRLLLRDRAFGLARLAYVALRNSMVPIDRRP